VVNFNKNRVLLLYPAADLEQLNLIPLSLLYIAQPLIEDGIDVEIIDQRLEKDFFYRAGYINGSSYQNIKRVMELFSLYQQRRLDFRWICTGRVDEVLSLDDDALRFLKERGLFAIYFGIKKIERCGSHLD
jgi:hypothetical protein